MINKRHYNEALEPDGLLTPEEQDQVNAAANKEQASEKPTDIIVKEEQQPAEGGYTRTRRYLNDLIDASRERGEELQRREELSRAQEMVAGIADAGRAIGNLIYTTRYSPDAYADSGLSDKSRERAERYRAEREKNRDAIMNYYMMQDKLDDADKNWRYKLARDKKADEEALAEREWTERKWQAEQDEKKRVNDARIENQRQRNEIQKIKAMASRSGGKNGGGSKSKPIVIYDEDGTTYEIPGDKDYSEALSRIYGFVDQGTRKSYNKRLGLSGNNPIKGIGAYLSDPNGDEDVKANIREALNALSGGNNNKKSSNTPATKKINLY